MFAMSGQRKLYRFIQTDRLLGDVGHYRPPFGPQTIVASLNVSVITCVRETELSVAAYMRVIFAIEEANLTYTPVYQYGSPLHKIVH